MVDTASNADHWDMFWAEHASKGSLFHHLLWRIRLLFTKAYAHHLRNVVGHLHTGRILEVGCGSARTLHHLEQHYTHSLCYAFDISSEAIKLVRNISPTNQTTIANALSLPLQDETFDLVFSIGLIEHFTRAKAQEIVSENVRVARPYGYVGIVVPWQNSIYNLIVRKAFGRLWPFGDENPFRRRELVSFMGNLGLQDIRVFILYGSTLLGVGRRGVST